MPRTSTYLAWRGKHTQIVSNCAIWLHGQLHPEILSPWTLPSLYPPCCHNTHTHPFLECFCDTDYVIWQRNLNFFTRSSSNIRTILKCRTRTNIQRKGKGERWEMEKFYTFCKPSGLLVSLVPMHVLPEPCCLQNLLFSLYGSGV